LSGNITGVSVALDNELLANTSASGSTGLNLAEIDKKHITISGTTTNPMVSGGVPEPTTYSLLIGTAALTMRRRRREI
jgi:hypothetical protein